MSTHTWLVVANTNVCHIYVEDHHQLTLCKTLEHPENKLRDIDITADKPGHYQTSHAAHGAYSQSTDPKDALIDAFAREIAHAVEQGRTHNQYEKVIFVIPPHMYGCVHKHLNKHVEACARHIGKDALHLDTQALLALIHEH